MQPTPYAPGVDFSQEEANGVAGRSTVRTAALDAELAAIQVTSDEVLVNLALIQRDDGELLDGITRIASLSAEVLALISSSAFQVRGSWVTATDYAVGNVVLQNNLVYVCFTAHTSGTFATDLAANKWGQITASNTATSISFSPTTYLSSVNVQAAISELDDDLRPMNSILTQQLFHGL